MRKLIYLGHQYLTSDGHGAHILTTSMKHPTYPVVALIDFGGYEEPVVLTKTGCFDYHARNHPYDLVKDVTEET
jgi:hypothetical protein